MPQYTCRLLNNDNRIDDVESFRSASHERAQAQAYKILANSNLVNFELWLDKRLICRSGAATTVANPPVVALSDMDPEPAS